MKDELLRPAKSDYVGCKAPVVPIHVQRNECGILNLENSDEVGSHWVAYFKQENKKYYFDSYGDAKPPVEIIKYLGKDNLYYNKDRIQFYDDPPICGHLSLLVLNALCTGSPFTTETMLKCKDDISFKF